MVFHTGVPGAGDAPALENGYRYFLSGIRAFYNNPEAAEVGYYRYEFLPGRRHSRRAAGGDFNLGGDAFLKPSRLPEVAV